MQIIPLERSAQENAIKSLSEQMECSLDGWEIVVTWLLNVFQKVVTCLSTLQVISGVRRLLGRQLF